MARTLYDIGVEAKFSAMQAVEGYFERMYEGEAEAEYDREHGYSQWASEEDPWASMDQEERTEFFSKVTLLEPPF